VKKETPDKMNDMYFLSFEIKKEVSDRKMNRMSKDNCEKVSEMNIN
jgi:hypothetical protein